MTEQYEQRVINTIDNPGVRCECVSDHNPNAVQLHVHHIWPLGLGGPDEPDNEILLCPTTHDKVHRLLRNAVRAGVTPKDLPWPVRRAMGTYAVDMAHEGYRRWQAGTVS